MDDLASSGWHATGIDLIRYKQAGWARNHRINHIRVSLARNGKDCGLKIERVVLHRKELVNKRPPFEALTNPLVEFAFNTEFLERLRAWEYVVITVLIDKLQHFEQYHTWRYDPYHYCLKVLIERYVQWLERHGAMGDVLAESRGGKEDQRLKKWLP